MTKPQIAFPWVDHAPVLLLGQTRAKRGAKTLPLRSLAVAIRLDDSSATGTAAVPELKWIHLATEGEFRGHAQGAFQLTREVFGSFVANLRADPRYKPDEAGVGSAKVLQFDYEHASELDPTSGSIPTSGAPAAAWLYELAIRESADGKAELWGLAKLNSKIREQIAADEYAWVSIAFVLRSIDPKSGEQRGPKLTSVAFTNKPFIQELNALAASDRDLSDYYVRPACDLEDLCRELRSLFKLEETAGAAECCAECLKVCAMCAAPETIPAGVDCMGLCGAIRVLLGCPMNTPPNEVARICSEVLNPPVTVGASQSENDMDLKRLAAALKCRATITEDEMITLADQATTDSGDLSKLLEALGVSNPAAALAALPELMAAKSKLADMQKQMDDLMAYKQQAESAQVQQDVAAAMSAHRFPEAARPAMLALRQSDPKLFAEKYPVPDAEKQKLLGNVVAGPGGAQYQPPKTLAAGEQRPGEGGDKQLDVRGYPGRNAVEKVCAYLREKDPAAKHWGLDALVSTAGRMLREQNVITG